MLQRILLLSVIVCLTTNVWAQRTGEQDKFFVIEKRIELIAENLETEEIDFTTLFDDLEYFFDHPINLNRAESSDLSRLFLLSDFQIKNLGDHIRKTGKLLSIYELQGIDGFDVETIRTIRPFVFVSNRFDRPQLSFEEIWQNGKSEWFFRYIRILEEQQGYSDIDPAELANRPNSRYLGSPDRLYSRYRYRYGSRLSLGITAEKDAGETFFTGEQKQGFDYYSAHAFFRDFGPINQLAVGDYQLQFGQGLTLWSGLGFGKSPDVLNIKRTGSGIRPYTSVDENRFLRGVASTVRLKEFDVTAFYSSKRIDANLIQVDSSDQVDVAISSFQTSGFHRTPAELEDKDALRERHVGGRVSWNKSAFTLGATAVQTDYEGSVNRNLQNYNQFDFNSNSNAIFGIDADLIYRNFNFFGEVARSENGGIGYVGGLLAALDPRLSFSLLHRNYQTDFQSILSNGIGEASRSQNERGTYIGLVAKPISKFTISAYYDQFRFPWLRFRVDNPSHGSEYLVQIDYRPSKALSFYVRYREEEKYRNSLVETAPIRETRKQNRQSLRGNMSYTITPGLTLRSRIELSRYQLQGETNESGYLAFQDVNYKPLGKPYSFSFRYALFDTESFDTRIYAYENDVLYFFAIPAYFSRGTRTYLTTKFRFNRSIDLWLRIAQTYFSDRDQVGTGTERIDGNTRTEFKAQVRLRF